MEDSFHERGKALEDLYFQQKDQQLLAKLKEEMANEENRKSLERATGIHDADVLAKMTSVGITLESMLALSMVPLVSVAWADGSMESSEKLAILQAADVAGIDKGTTAHALLESWLTLKPVPALLESWESYIRSLRETFEPVVFKQLRHQILERSETVARAAGGFLGIVNPISAEERAMLDRLKRAFDE